MIHQWKERDKGGKREREGKEGTLPSGRLLNGNDSLGHYANMKECCKKESPT